MSTLPPSVAPPVPPNAPNAPLPPSVPPSAETGGGAALGWRERLLPPPEILRRRLREWTGIFSAYFTNQTLTQLLGIGAGLLFVNLMPVREFALYTLATSVLTFFTFASDLGSTSSLVYFFHQATKGSGDFPAYLGAVLSLRRMAFALGIVVVAVVFPTIALRKGFLPFEITLVALGIALSTWFQISSAIRLLTLRLHDRYIQSYRAEVAGAGTRLVLALLMAWAAAMRAWLGIFAAAIGSAVTVRLAAAPALAPQIAPHELGPRRRRVLRYLAPSLPSALYFSVQGPLVVWLAATFGATKNIAEVGALGRLGLVVGLFSNLTGVVFLPRMARIVDPHLFRRRYFQYGGVLAAIGTGMLLGAALFPQGLLFLLGKHYAGLHRELLLVIGGGALTLLAGYAVGVNLSRAWNRWESLAVLILIAGQVTCVALLPLSTTAGVLLFNLLSTAVGLAAQLAITFTGFVRPRWVSWME